MNYTYEQAVSYIEETPKFTKKHGLSTISECLERLGGPQSSFRVIHVAGTNGKGSQPDRPLLRSFGDCAGMEERILNGKDGAETLSERSRKRN